MPVSGTGAVMAQLIVTELAAAGLFPTPAEQASSLQRWTAVCNQVIAHMVANTQVILPPGAVAVVTNGSPTTQSGANPAPALGTIA